MEQLPEEILDLAVAWLADPDTIPQLAVLRLPWRLDTDPRSWPHGPETWGPWRALWTVETVWRQPADVHEWVALAEQAQAEQAAFSLRHPFTHDGRHLMVETDYCAGFDFNYRSPGDPPLIFETAISDADGPVGRCWRYATKAAATHGHQQIVAALTGQYS